MIGLDNERGVEIVVVRFHKSVKWERGYGSGS